MVNKGNVGALEEITDETYQAVAGRQDQFVDLVPRLAELTAGLNRQVNDIIDAVDGLNRFSAILARDKDNLGRALDTLPEALRVLNKNRDHIVEAFAALKKLATVTSHVLAKTKVDFAEDLKGLYSVVKALNDNRKNFVTSLQLLLTFPFPNFGIKQAVRGDYLNVFTTFDLTLRRLGETFFTTAYFDPNMAHMDEILNPPDFLTGELANLSGQAADPFKIPPGTASGRAVGAAQMIDRLTKIQLGIFAVITAITLTVMGDLLPAAARHVRHRDLRRERRFRRGRRPVQERQRHLPRCRRRPGGVGGAEPQWGHRRNAAQQRYPHSVERHRHREERVGHR